MLSWQMEECWLQLACTWLPWQLAGMRFLLLFSLVFTSYVHNILTIHTRCSTT
ncbi:hypothetical protein M758_5G174300 [Ceratodon purpureus]|nr:hypothetical protein M758_5G174300 [Ceratodon purpureus]